MKKIMALSLVIILIGTRTIGTAVGDRQLLQLDQLVQDNNIISTDDIPSKSLELENIKAQLIDCFGHERVPSLVGELNQVKNIDGEILIFAIFRDNTNKDEFLVSASLVNETIYNFKELYRFNTDVGNVVAIVPNIRVEVSEGEPEYYIDTYVLQLIKTEYTSSIYKPTITIIQSHLNAKTGEVGDITLTQNNLIFKQYPCNIGADPGVDPYEYPPHGSPDSVWSPDESYVENVAFNSDKLKGDFHKASCYKKSDCKYWLLANTRNWLTNENIAYRNASLLITCGIYWGLSGIQFYLARNWRWEYDAVEHPPE